MFFAIVRVAVRFAIIFIAGGGCHIWANAQNDEKKPDWGLHGQSTFIWQAKPGFAAAYSGANSLIPQREESHSLTVTADLGLRLWPGAQLHINPEGSQGRPLSNLTGAGGISNGELQRGGGPVMSTYLARAFVQQRFGVGGGSETLDAGFNELGGQVDARRWTVTVGTFSLLDYFDPNPYAKDPRSQFTNWAFLTHGAWDYAADARGYTTGLMVEYRGLGWAARVARALQPRQSNGLALDPDLTRHYGDQAEIEGDLPVTLPGGPLRGRMLWFANRMEAGSYADALALGGVPDVGLVRRDQIKTGWGLTLEAPMGPDAGFFLRASRNSGNLETYAFTEIDSQWAVGAQFTGAAWGRPQDRWGLAFASNGLSDSHRNYLAAGGQGFFLGDGRLNYGEEQVLEGYYRWVVPPLAAPRGRVASAFSLGWQTLANPGYNRDRGPVQVITARWHAEF